MAVHRLKAGVNRFLAHTRRSAHHFFERLKRVDYKYETGYTYLVKWSGISVLIGLIGGVVVYLFLLLLGFMKTSFYELPIWTVFLPALGGLAVGLIVFTISPESAGHGTDAAIRAYHKEGRMRGRTAPVKMLSSAITIGSGGSAGREGPVVQSVASVASTIGQFLKFKEDDLKVMLVLGMAAAFGAVFKSPLGGGLFAISVLYRRYDIDYKDFAPAVISSITAYITICSFVGTAPMLSAPPYAFDWHDMPVFILLAIICGGICIGYVIVFYKTAKLFQALPVNPIFKPAIGGLVVGYIGIYFPHILGLGVEFIEDAIYGQMFLTLAIALIILKIVATSFTLGSGGSGGVITPTLFIGAMVGASMASVFDFSPHVFAILCMAFLLAGVGNIPLVATVLVVEMFGWSYFIPAVIGSIVTYFVSSTRFTIFESQWFSMKVEKPTKLI
jgi:CIC family chloride channel protein